VLKAVCRGTRSGLLFAAALCLFARPTTADEALLTEALAGLQKRGLPLIFSSDLVRPDMRVLQPPKAHDPRAALDELLAPHGLAVQEGPSGSLLVVRASNVKSTEGSASEAGSLEKLPGGVPVGAAHFRESVDVQDQASIETGLASALDVRPLDVITAAGAVENVYRAIQMLPGVAGVNELEGRVSVRGGSPDQNLTVMDGVEMHNPYRLFGLATAFNPDTIEKFELVTGAFHPRYGDRLSSILVVDTREGSRAKAFSLAGNLSITDTNAILEGRLPGPGEPSWLLTGRRTYYDLVLDESLPSQRLPSFSDLQLKTAWSLGGGRRLALLGMRNRENSIIRFGSDDHPTDLYHTSTRNEVVSARLTAPIGGRTSSTTVASWYTSTDEMAPSLSTDDTQDSSRSGDTDTFDWVDIVLARHVRIRDLSLRHEISHQASARHLLGAGFDAHSIGTALDWRMSLRDGYNFLSLGPTTRPDGAGALSDEPFPSKFRGGLWVHDRFQPSVRLTLEGGLRLDRGGITPRTSLSPRAAAHFRLDKSTVVGLAAGVHTQSTGFEKFLQRNFVFNGSSLFDLTQLPPGGLRNERSLQFVATLERKLRPSLDLRVEAFYKKFDDLIVNGLETEEERQARLARYDFPQELESSRPTEARLTRRPTNDGRGRAFGVEVLLSRRAPSADARFGGWVSYAFSSAKREAYGIDYPFDYDRPHALSIVGMYRPFRGLELSATARVASGFPWKRPSGLRVQGVVDIEDRDHDGNDTELVPSDDSINFGTGYLPFFTAEAARERGPVYSRVDARMSFHPRWWGGHWTLYLDVINVLGQRNYQVPNWNWNDGYRGSGSTELQQNREDETGLPRVPTLGIKVRF
jgi:hypothetical protein